MPESDRPISETEGQPAGEKPDRAAERARQRGRACVDDWFSCIRLPISPDEFHHLPRNPAYKYEYLGDYALLSPRPKSYHAILELEPQKLETAPRCFDGQPAVVRLLGDRDWEALPELFAAAFDRVQPFASLDEAEQVAAARALLQTVRTGGEGPLIDAASFVAVPQDEDEPVGAALVTLARDVDLASFDDTHWPEPPPPDCIARRLGRPHLTWIFVGPWHARNGIGSALLAAATQALLGLGYSELASTFLLGNESSMLWHWRNGFRLLAWPGSPRHWRHAE